MLGDDVHVAAAADRPARRRVDRRERQLRARPPRPRERRLGPVAEARLGRRPGDRPAARSPGRGATSASRGTWSSVERLEADDAGPRGRRARRGRSAVIVRMVDARLDSIAPAAASADAPAEPRRHRRSPVTDFADRVDAFLDEYFALDPIDATGAGDHDHDGRWPDLSAAGRAGAPGLHRRWHGDASARSTTTSRRRRARSIATCSLGELDAHRFDEVELARGRLEPAGLGLPARRRALRADRPRVRAAGRPAGLDRRAAGGAAGVSSTPRAATLVGSRGPAGRPVPRPRPRSTQLAGHRRRSSTMRWRPPRRPRRPTRPSPRSCPRLDAAAATARRARGASSTTCATCPAAAARARAGSGRSCSPRRCATRCAPRR